MRKTILVFAFVFILVVSISFIMLKDNSNVDVKNLGDSTPAILREYSISFDTPLSGPSGKKIINGNREAVQELILKERMGDINGNY